MTKSLSSIDPLAAWRAHFSVETQRRGEEYARDGSVELLEHDGRRVEARVRGRSALYEVGLDLRSQNLRDCSCTCPAFDDLGTCKHIWAVLNVVLVGVSSTRAGASAAELRAWLTGVLRAELSAERTSTEDGPAEPACRVDYVLVLDDVRAATSTVLETRRAKPLARGGFGKAAPFALLAPRKDVVLAPEDLRIAALLRGAGSNFSGPYRSRTESHYFLDGEQTRALLPALCATGRLYWSRRGASSARPLTLDEGRVWKPCMTLDKVDGSGALQLRARIQHGAERVEGKAVHGVLAGDFVVLDERVVPARLGRGRAWFLTTTHAPPPPFSPLDAPGMLLELARRELDAEPGPGLESLITARRPIVHLTLAAPRQVEGKWSRVTGLVEFDYGVARVLATDRRPLLPTGRGVLRRYFEVEDSYLERALALGASASARGSLTVELERLPELVRALTAEEWVVTGEGAKYRALGALHISIKSGIDWFELAGRVEGVGADSFPALLAAMRRGQSTVLLGDGTTGIVPDAWVSRWKTALSLGETHEGRLRFRSHQAWFVDLLLAGLLDEFVDRESERMWAEQKKRLAEFDGIQPGHEPRGFHGELRPYQRDGLGWLEFLERQRFGGCLADDMGLGKTVQVLAWLQARKERAPDAAPALIVAPKSLTHNWLEEARRFTPELTALEYVGKDRKSAYAALREHDLVLTTYGTARIDVELLSKIEFGVVVLDEAQAIKNEDSRTARSMRLLRADHRLALSGTPIENHLGELWSLFEFLNPGLLGRSSAFQTLVTAGAEGEIDESARKLVAGAIRPFLLRRTKEEVLRDLPERTEQTVLCDMDTEQRREYVELRDHFRRTLLEGKNDAELHADKLGILEMLLRLRQAACHPALLDRARAAEGCAKFEAFFPMLEEVLEAGHKALVFSQFTSFLALVRRRLDADGRTYGYLDGKTPAKKRAEEVARFQEDPERKLFLISLKAGGTGLNLTAADYVFLLDPWWNPAVEAQAIGRSHRIGQERKVFAYRLVCRDTIEERVLELQVKKRALAGAILDGDGSLVRDLTRADLERLLS